MPAAVLVFVILGAFAVDLSAVHVEQRELVAAAQGAANDAAAVGTSEAAFYEDNEVRFDAGLAREAAVQSLAANGRDDRLTSFAIVDGSIVVEVASSVPTVFAKAVPGAPDRVDLHARATATLRE
jgi:hypothetical protein